MSFSLRLRGRVPLLLLTLTSLAATVAALGDAAPATATPGRTPHYAVNRPLCAARGAQFRCFAMERVSAAAGTSGAYRVTAFGHGPRGGYSPADLAKAYGYDPDAHVSQTVAIVDWNDDPEVLADLNTFDRTYGLPTETSRSFRKVNQKGRSRPLPAASRDSATEIALDVQAVRAVCHRCRILLVEADAATARDLAEAENTAARLGANEISNSFGGVEAGAPASMINAFHHPGVVITASTGDDGWYGWDYVNGGYWPDAAPSYPATDPAVVAVGGTSLRVNPDGSRQSETVWNRNGADDASGQSHQQPMGATGGGCSRRFGAGGWQWRVPSYGENRCGADRRNRVAADIAAVGDPGTGFDVRDSYGVRRWVTVGGTSLSSPLVAAMYALAGGSGGSAYPAASLYVNSARQPSDLYDVVSGGNAFCGGETALSKCMSAVTKLDSTTNNPNALTGDPLDCSFRRDGLNVTSAPTPGRQCNAEPGYDGPSGLGAPTGLGIFRPTSAVGSLAGPAVPRLKRTQTWRATFRERISTASITSYGWSWGDGKQTSTVAPTAAHAFTRPGRYLVSVSAYDTLHHVVRRSRVITVGVGPAVRFTGPRHLHPGRRASFSSAGSHAVNTGARLARVVWGWGDGHVTSTATARAVRHRYSAPGHYHLRLTVRDSTGASRTIKRTITVAW